MQKIFDERWYAEVLDPDSGFSHLATHEIVTFKEDDAVVAEEGGEEEEEGGEEGEGGEGMDVMERWKLDPALSGRRTRTVRVVKAKPPRLEFATLKKDVLEVRQLARAGRDREDALRKKLKGKEVEHWVQGPLFADLEEEEEETTK